MTDSLNEREFDRLEQTGDLFPNMKYKSIDEKEESLGMSMSE